MEKRSKLSYVENISKGTLITFRDSERKMVSAKVVGKDVKERLLFVKTKYGAKYSVSFDDIEWVKTGKRWPRYVYNALKGIEDEKVEDKQKTAGR